LFLTSNAQHQIMTNSKSKPIKGLLKVLTNHAFIWVTFGLMLVASSAIAGAGIGYMFLPQKDDSDGSPTSETDVTVNPELATYQWQAILHCLATYFALIPMLWKKKKDDEGFIRWKWSRKSRETKTKETIADVIFFITVLLGFLTAIAAPIVLQAHYIIADNKRRRGLASASADDELVLVQAVATALNFASVVFSTAAAGQLAAKVTT
jgi:hypothetical protein